MANNLGDDERWGQRVCTIIETKLGYSIEPNELQDQIHGSLAGYKIPRDLRFVGHIERQLSRKGDYHRALDTASGRFGSP
jgi:acyl-CoA synthetase (AMP-forming)/AMP-acid ligase II